MTIRIAVVEDQTMVRAGLRMVIDSQPDLAVALEAPDGFDLPSRLADSSVDVVLMDIQMPRVDGIQATEAVMAMPDPPFIGRLPDAGRHAHQGAPLTATLSPREREVRAAMARGGSNPEIAAPLHLSEATVKSHVGRIFAKTGSRDRVHAVILAFRDGLVDPAELASQASRRSTDQTPAT